MPINPEKKPTALERWARIESYLDDHADLMLFFLTGSVIGYVLGVLLS